MRISDWSSDVCSSDLRRIVSALQVGQHQSGGSEREPLGLAGKAERRQVLGGSLVVIEDDDARCDATHLPQDVQLVTEINNQDIEPGYVGCRIAVVGGQIGKASGRERVCHYV